MLRHKEAVVKIAQLDWLRLLLVLLLSSSCTRMMWVKPGATDADFRSDSYECARDARQSGYFGTGFAGAINMSAFAKRCMHARGYDYVPADATAHEVK
jgi:hypothetical protein